MGEKAGGGGRKYVISGRNNIRHNYKEGVQVLGYFLD